MKYSVAVDQVRSSDRLIFLKCKELHPFGPVVALRDLYGAYRWIETDHFLGVKYIKQER